MKIIEYRKGTTKMKKLLSLVLALVMLLSVASIASAEDLTNMNIYETQLLLT